MPSWTVAGPTSLAFDDGTLTISYGSLTWDGLPGFLKPGSDTVAVTVPVLANGPIELGVPSAAAIVSGLGAGASVKGMSGDITLDGGAT